MQALRIISEDHSNLWRLTTTIDHVAGEIEEGAPVDPRFFNSVFDYLEHFVDRAHHPKEDDFLFRIMRERSSRAAGILDPLQQDHRNGPDQLSTLRALMIEASLHADRRAEFLKNPAITIPPELQANCEIIEVLGPDLAKYSKVWDQVKAAQ